MLDIEGASAIVTGGASGLGAATARTLAERGARVVVLDRQRDLGQKVASEVEGIFVEADVADEQLVTIAVEAAGELGPLRVLINCAGTSRAARTIGRDGTPFDLKTFNFILQVKPGGNFQLHSIDGSSNE